MDPSQSQFNYRQIPVRLQRDPKKLFHGLRADPRKIPKRKSQLDPPEKTPKGFRTDRKKILGFVWENSSVLRLFPAFPTAFPGRRQSQELHHLLQRRWIPLILLQAPGAEPEWALPGGIPVPFPLRSGTEFPALR